MSKLGQAYRESTAARQAADKAAADKDYQEQLPARIKRANSALKDVREQLSAHFTTVAAELVTNKVTPNRRDFKAHIGKGLKIEDVNKLSETKKVEKLCKKEDVGIRSIYYPRDGDIRISIDLQSCYPTPTPKK